MPALVPRIKLAVMAASSGAASAWSALWTFPSMLLSAFLVAWGAEAAQFLIAQGLALAILAWLQTLPEFAVEAVIAWHAGHDAPSCFVALPPAGCTSHLAIANFTGAIRLLIGLGWPMIYAVSAVRVRRTGRVLGAIQLDEQHAVEVLGTVPPLAYFVWVWWKGSLGPVDAAVLIAMYAAYLGVLWRLPPESEEGLADAPAVSRWAYTRPRPLRGFAIGALFVGGGALIYLTAHPFLNSMLALAATLGVSQFVFVQWVAPFVSEFPEKVSAFQWANRPGKAPMAMMNMMSSNINQWTVLAAMIPIAFSLARGTPAALPFDGPQRDEILLTIMQSVVAVLLLLNLRFEWWNAAIVFVLWLAQFLVPDWRNTITWVYGAWAVGLVMAWPWMKPVALPTFVGLLRGDLGRH